MTKCELPDVVITGVGIASSIGQGKAAFTNALLNGRDAFDIMRRPGRQNGTSFLGAEISDLEIPTKISPRLLRTSSYSAKAILCTVLEAWQDAALDAVDPCQIGLIVGGSNFQQREIVRIHEKHAHHPEFLHPPYALSFLDTDVCGLCTEQFGIGGFAYTLGGASASGQMAVISAAQAVAGRQVEACIAVGALMDLSYWECQALRSLGAMGSDRYADEPHRACRPFDKERDGFIYGESCGAVVIERIATAEQRKARPYAVILGWATVMDRHRNPDPCYEGEVSVIKQTLRHAHLKPEAVDYINPHGTGSLLGDKVEVEALKTCGLGHAFINATKSILGHGLSAAGTSEIVATLLQMESECLHPTLNLEDPIEPGFNWVRQSPVPHTIRNAISLSLGFGGINTAVCLSNARLLGEKS
jgi:malonyl-ACP decarboxylase